MKKNTILIIIGSIAVLLAAVVAIAVVISTGRRGEGEIEPGQEIHQEDLKEIPEETDVINVLAVGLDYSEEITDVIIYVRFDPEEKTAKLLSIPRDTYVGDEFSTGKINNIYKSGGGIDRLVSEIEERMLLPVDYYATITLDSLGDLVDQIGGVEITLEEDIYDQGQKLFSAGTQTLNGEQAQLFVRQRHAYANADLGRIEAQHQFLLACMKKVQSLGKLQMLQLAVTNFDAVTTDMPLNKMISVAATAFSLGEEDVFSYTVPGVGKMNYSYAVYEVDKPALAELLNEEFFSEPITAEELDFPEVTYVAPPLEETEDGEPEDEGLLEEDEDTGEESGRGNGPIYPDPHDYNAWEDGDFDTWYERNTIYPGRGGSSKSEEESSEEEEASVSPQEDAEPQPDEGDGGQAGSEDSNNERTTDSRSGESSDSNQKTLDGEDPVE